MKKLLHERLRDSKGAIETLDGKVIILFNIEAQALADEIERYYKPLPRYEDGEPVQFGDEFVDGGGNTHTLHEIRYRDDAARGLGAPIILKADTTSCHDGVAYNVFDEQLIKRPSPKEPDSLERLLDDMRSFGEVGADCTSDCCLQYADRLSALIEKVN